jgi:hypothetical protein
LQRAPPRRPVARLQHKRSGRAREAHLAAFLQHVPDSIAGMHRVVRASRTGARSGLVAAACPNRFWLVRSCTSRSLVRIRGAMLARPRTAGTTDHSPPLLAQHRSSDPFSAGVQIQGERSSLGCPRVCFWGVGVSPAR